MSVGTIAPGSTFEAWTDAFATGLTGTLGVRIRTAAGANFLNRTTAGIAEDVTQVYRRSFTAPSTAGDYVIVWDDTTTFKAESFTVSFSSPTTVGATGRDLCSLTDVGALVPGYVIGDDTATDTILQTLITEQSRDAMERTRREFVPIAGMNPRVFDVDQTVVRRRKIYLGDITTVATVTVADQYGTTISTVTSADYVLYPRILEDWEPYGWIWLRPDTSNPASLYTGYTVSVNGTWGFPAVPATVKDAVARLVLLRYLNDTAAAGTELSNALNRADLNLGAWWRQALDALDRFAIASF